MSAVQTTLHGRTCLLTAASGGLGQALTQVLARCGCHLFLSGRNTDRLLELQRDLAERYPLLRVACAPADLEDAEAVVALAGQAERELGQIDMLINNAGAFLHRPLVETELEEFERCYRVNVRAPFLLTKALAPQMARRGWGRIVNIGSSSAYAGFKGTAAYCSSKHGLLGLSRAAYQELREHNVRTFCISPGSIKTPMGRLVPGQDFESFMEPAEVAEYIAFVLGFDGALVSDEVRLNRIGIV